MTDAIAKLDPFLLPDRSIISFSGGRTSGYMLWRHLQAHGGTLPDGVKVVFCNTGKEREETLEFVNECSQRWGVPITWLEYRCDSELPYVVEVDYTSASRNGEPFRQMILLRGFLPNPVARICTVELKMLTLNRYVRQHLLWDTYTNVVGLRADEDRRVRKAKPNVFVDVQLDLFGEPHNRRRVKSGRPTGEAVVFPLHAAGVTLADVRRFWDESPFDLSLSQDEGNCDLCFLKGSRKIVNILRDRPELADWWAEMETLVVLRDGRSETSRFRSDRPGYHELKMIATDQQDGPGWLWADSSNSVSCGELHECRCTD